MKKTITILFCIPFIFQSLFGQNDFKIPINQKGFNTPGINMQKLMLPCGNNYFGEHNYFQVNNHHYQKLSGNNLNQVVKQCLDSAVIEFYNHFTIQWVPIGKFQYTYDGFWNMISEIDYSWNESLAQWSSDFKQDYSYDSIGNISGRIDFSPIGSNGQWVCTSKVDYSYNILGNRIQEIYFNWDETISQWKEYNKVEYIYDVTGKLAEKFDYYWNTTTDQWVYNFKYEYSYDSSGNIFQMLLYQWSLSTSQWIEYLKFISTYDEFGELIQNTKYQWYESYGQWRAKDREDYSYDSLSNLIQNIQYYWNQVSEIWELNSKGEYSYNNDFSIDDLILPNYFFADGTAELYFQHKLFEMNFSVWNSLYSQWGLSERHSCYFSEVNFTDISEINKEYINIYPNPADEFIHINAEKSLSHSKFVMYDIQGRNIYEKEILGNTQFFIGNLMGGLYLYYIIRDDKVQTGKIILK